MYDELINGLYENNLNQGSDAREYNFGVGVNISPEL